MSSIPPQFWAIIIGLVMLGGVVSGFSTLLVFVSTLISIWNAIRPKTDQFATRDWIESIERRTQQRFEESDQRFAALLTEIKSQGHEIIKLATAVAGIEGSIRGAAEKKE